MTSHSEFDGEPLALAEETLALASELCGGCRDYHGVRPYLRLIGVGLGIERHDARLTYWLQRLVPRAGQVLIAGAGDSGTLRRASDSLGDRAPVFTVVDRCSTPLELCRRFAESRGLALVTREQDLAEFDDSGAFDLVLMHRVLGFLPAPAVAGVLSRLCRSLKPGGRLLLVFDSGNPPMADQLAGLEGRMSEQAISALDGRGIRLPEPRAQFTERVRGYARIALERLSRFRPYDEIAADFAIAGLVIEVHEPLAARVHALAGVPFHDDLVIARPAS